MERCDAYKRNRYQLLVNPGILQRARRHHVPVALIAGRIADSQQLLDAGFSQVACINERSNPALENVMNPDVAKRNIRHTVVTL